MLRSFRKSVKSMFKGSSASSQVIQKNFKETYTLEEERELGKGNFSVVKAAKHNVTGQRVAVKVMKKNGLNKEDLTAVKNEAFILHTLNHPHIIKFHGIFEDETNLYIVSELLEGGELFDRIVQKEYYQEKHAATVIKKMLEALEYCEKQKVVHRDLKPENVLLVDREDDLSVKLADFGFAKEIANEPRGSELKTVCGTPGYVAPEIISNKGYSKEVDMWSLGVISYILLCGYPPFYDDNQRELFKKIKTGVYAFDKEFWGEISDDAKDFIRRLLTLDPKKRMTAKQALEHPWMIQGGSDKDITPALAELKQYMARRRLKKGFAAVKAINRLKNLGGVVTEETVEDLGEEES